MVPSNLITLMVKGPWVASAYYGDQSGSALDKDGWFAAEKAGKKAKCPKCKTLTVIAAVGIGIRNVLDAGEQCAEPFALRGL